jgi:hypothetical protein
MAALSFWQLLPVGLMPLPRRKVAQVLLFMPNLACFFDEINKVVPYLFPIFGV